MNFLTKEEIVVLEGSPVCLNCGHREVLHNTGYEEGVECNACECTELIKEGDYSYWSIQRYKYNQLYNTSVYKELERNLADGLHSLSSRNLELSQPTGKTIRIKRYSRLELP